MVLHIGATGEYGPTRALIHGRGHRDILGKATADQFLPRAALLQTGAHLGVEALEGGFCYGGFWGARPWQVLDNGAGPEEILHRRPQAPVLPAFTGRHHPNPPAVPLEGMRHCAGMAQTASLLSRASA